MQSADITSLDIIALIKEVKRADQLVEAAKQELEAAEELLREIRSKHRAAQQYQTVIKNFTKALLDARDPNTQERIRSKYQKKLANFQDPASLYEAKTASRNEIEKNIGSLMTLAEKALAEIATKVKGETNNITKAATAAAE